MSRQLAVVILCRGMGTETALDGNSGVVKDDTARNTAVILEGTDDGIQEALQILPFVSKDIGCTAMAEPGTEQIYDQLFTIDVNGSLTPVDLDSFSRGKPQRNKCLCFLACGSHIVDHIPDRRFTAGETAFLYQPLVNSTGCMPLFLYPFTVILIQTGRNKLNHIWGHDSRISAVLLPVPGDGVAFPVLFNGIAGNAELLSRRSLPCNTLQLQTPDLFVHIHRSYHLFFSSYNSVDSIVGHLTRWLKYSLSFSPRVAQVHISIYNFEWEYGAVSSTELGFDISDRLMRWYEYEISIGPGERIVNTVMAPIYPDINSRYEPPIFEYTYLLSPAQTWAEFGNLDIVVNTPYYMTVSGPEGFQYNNPGYELHLTGLPEGELTFTLCAEAEPKAPSAMGYVYPEVLLIGAAVLMAIVVVVVFARRGRKRSRGNDA